MKSKLTLTILPLALLLYGSAASSAARTPPATPPPFNLKDASTVTVQMPMAKAFEVVVNSLKRQGFSVEIADKDGGNIATAFTTAKKHTRSRVEIVLIQDNDHQTTLRIAAIDQAKDYSFSAGPYDYKSPVVDAQSTAEIVGKLKEAFSL